MLERDRALEYEHDGQRWSAPRTADEVAAACAKRPKARIVAGMRRPARMSSSRRTATRSTTRSWKTRSPATTFATWD